VVGAPLATEQLQHERLGKPTALAVFASDNLSSSAYATEEILRVLIAGGLGTLAFARVVPITVALLVVLGILLFSYRQTIKAYPQAGGAYLVTRDNFGLLPAQVAGVSLLTDYILTVSVSVAAGTAALTSVYPSLYAWRVHISVAFIVIIMMGNLRGVRESGKLFATPTYFFIAMMMVLLIIGLFRLATGALPQHQHTFALTPGKSLTTKALVFLILKAYASGGAAVTGVEAISNGVPAFKPPEWLNARTTLMWMGTLLGTMFIGLSILAAHLRVVPDPSEKVTIVAQIGKAVFGGGALGNGLLTLLQVATMLILVLAANTSFADFPRLASFHAGDHFLPSQLTRHGDRLVFSNGIMVLSGFSILLVIVFHASVTRLIPLYAIGVFTSFTFSQAGMAKRHIKLKEQGWRVGLAINGLGAVVTGVVTVVIAATKFTQGAYIILAAVPIMLFGLIRVNRHYKQVGAKLRDSDRRLAPARNNHVVLLVGRPSVEERRAFAYAERIGTDDIHCVHFRRPGTPGVEAQWARELGIALTAPALEEVHAKGPLPLEVRSYVKNLRKRIDPCDFVTVIIAERVEGGLIRRLGTPRSFLLKTTLLFTPGVVVTDIPNIAGAGDTVLVPGRPVRHIAVVLVSGVHNATLRALSYTGLLDSDEMRAVHVSIDPHATEQVVADWQEWDPGHPLEVIASPFRSLTKPVQSYVRDLTADGDTLVTIVLPEFVVESWWRQFLHNQSALALKRLFVTEPAVVVTSVPYHLRNEVPAPTPS
jgi:amino acid transporter